MKTEQDFIDRDALIGQMRLLNHTLKCLVEAFLTKSDLLLGNKPTSAQLDELADRLKMNRVETVHKRVWP